jgi:hypothetical protein
LSSSKATVATANEAASRYSDCGLAPGLSGSPLTTSTEYGPRKPPRFPIELITAMPTAADASVRNSAGSAQKGAM